VFEVCPHCGLYSETKQFSHHIARCPHCQQSIPFVAQPLFVLTGASGTGKSTLAQYLAPRLAACVTLEADTFLACAPLDASDDYRAFRDYSLRVARDVGQSGRPVLLGGSATPGQYEKCPNAGFFSAFHYLALVCEDDELRQRLQSRPAWRGSSTPEFIETMRQFNQWFRSSAYTHDLLDTTYLSIADAAAVVTHWVQARL
jgi:shikimate kinase